MSPRRITEVPLPDESVIEAVRASCARLPAGSTRLAERFYENLFAMAPDVRAMFPDDLRPQHKRMATALLEVVRHLDSPDDVAGYLQDLGAQHQRELNVKPEHYPFVGRSLVRAVSEISPTWSSSMSSAWVLVYEWITANMLAGAERAAEHVNPRRRAPGTPQAVRESVPSGAPVHGNERVPVPSGAPAHGNGPTPAPPAAATHGDQQVPVPSRGNPQAPAPSGTAAPGEPPPSAPSGVPPRANPRTPAPRHTYDVPRRDRAHRPSR
ncbi:globin domain-containing protein [Nocardiopsis sp. NRRL B-16309]|uniref:globin domain-containing protein n=1 Tax=Nocardiopsis sp. NRRL B-16309 TaxID=1519494 RepID=UPI0009E80F08|nr:globin domain-containing protein [Nocardiopsis sp. NRRL B-16309]